MEISIRSSLPEEKPLFYTDQDRDRERRCIGHLRGDFGRNGREFWTTWWEHAGELKTQEFRTELDELVNSLRENSLLKSRSSMTEFCSKHPEARIPGSWHPDVFGFCIETERHRYYLRCFPQAGDYNFYVYCYQQENREYETGERGNPQAPVKKRPAPER